MIDMHAHWRPAEVADALRAQTREPRILRNEDSVEVLKSGRMGDELLALHAVRGSAPACSPESLTGLSPAQCFRTYYSAREKMSDFSVLSFVRIA